MIKFGVTYKHYKGGIYVPIDYAEHTETGEKLVIYKALSVPGKSLPLGKLWARPEAMFEDQIVSAFGTCPRFTEVEP